jgi:CheY-like chemotaxis protein
MKVDFDLILLVDDDEVANYLHQLLLKQLDFNVEIKTALNGEQALEITREVSTTEENGKMLVLLDLNMPVMNGFEYLEELHKIKPSVNPYILVLTSSLNPQDLKVARKMGVSGYIDKPLTGVKLMNALNSAGIA